MNGDTETMTSYLNNNGVKVIDITKTSHDRAIFNSFKVSIPLPHLTKVFNEHFWPNGIYCKSWYNRANNYDDSSHEADDGAY